MLERALFGAPGAERARVVEAFVALREGAAADAAGRKRLQDHVKAVIAPYKYPRSMRFVAALPKTETGKVQRFKLREGEKATLPDSVLAGDTMNAAQGRPE